MWACWIRKAGEAVATGSGICIGRSGRSGRLREASTTIVGQPGCLMAISLLAAADLLERVFRGGLALGPCLLMQISSPGCLPTHPVDYSTVCHPHLVLVGV